jgi:DNA end-binding protein Ku
MMRTSWKGNISFGLVNIPVALEVAETHDRVSFHMLDKNDMSPVKYKLVNGNTNDELSRKDVVKGYEFKENDYVVVTPDDFKKANVKATKTIDIQAFVDQSEILPVYFVRPYYVHPEKKAEKSYVLLREALRNSNKVGVAKIVMQAREHLCALMVLDDMIILELLRFAHEIKKMNLSDIPNSVKKMGLKPGEVKMAETLIEQMTEKFNPGQFKDVYQDDLKKYIKEKIKKGKHAKGKPIEDEADHKDEDFQQGKVVDFMSLLKRSVEKKNKGKRVAAAR